MANGVSKTPKDLNSDEDKWFNYFTKPQLAWTGAGGFIIFQIMKFSFQMHLVPIGLYFSILIGLSVFMLSRKKMPENMYLYAGGVQFDRIAKRIIIRRLNRVVYVKNYGEGGNSSCT